MWRVYETNLFVAEFHHTLLFCWRVEEDEEEQDVMEEEIPRSI